MLIRLKSKCRPKNIKNRKVEKLGLISQIMKESSHSQFSETVKLAWGLYTLQGFIHFTGVYILYRGLYTLQGFIHFRGDYTLYRGLYTLQGFIHFIGVYTLNRGLYTLHGFILNSL